MKQLSFADAEYAGKCKQTRRERFLIEMDQVVPWQALTALIEPYYPRGEGGRPAYPLAAMLRVHLMQNWFGYSDPAMEEALYEVTILRHFAGLHLDRIPDETTVLNFRRLLERHELASQILEVINGYGSTSLGHVIEVKDLGVWCSRCVYAQQVYADECQAASRVDNRYIPRRICVYACVCAKEQAHA